MRTKIKASAQSALPDGIRESDTVYPSYKSKDRLAREVGVYGELHLYETVSFGWCIATLGINRGRNGRAARVYAARISDGGVVRIGNGPHVKRVVSIYVRESRVAALKKYIDLYNSGAIGANTIRDRISSRRAEGQLRRQRGESYWRWTV